MTLHFKVSWTIRSTHRLLLHHIVTHCQSRVVQMNTQLFSSPATVTRNNMYYCGRDRVVGTMTTLWSRRSGVQFPAQSRKFHFSKTSWPALAPTQPSIQWVPKVRRPGREINHSPSSRAEVSNEWNYTPSSSMCLYGIHRDNFTFTCTCTFTFTFTMATFSYN